jgi:hypothetical protein
VPILKTKLLAALALTLTTAIAVPASAHEDPSSYPMPAATFEKHIDARLARAHSRMEQEILAQHLTDAQANEVRARFDAVASEVSAEVQKAVADGTVTLQEAEAVRAVARQLHRHHRRHHQGDDA